jgi:hypothetical protein
LSIMWYSIKTQQQFFRKLDLFSSSGEGWETPTLLGPLERANLNHNLLYFLEYQTMDKVQKPCKPGCYTPSSSEPLRNLHSITCVIASVSEDQLQKMSYNLLTLQGMLEGRYGHFQHLL